MIRLQHRERGIYVERFDNGFWHLLTIEDTLTRALTYVRLHFGIEEAERVQLQTERKDNEGKTS